MFIQEIISRKKNLPPMLKEHDKTHRKLKAATKTAAFPIVMLHERSCFIQLHEQGHKVINVYKNFSFT